MPATPRGGMLNGDPSPCMCAGLNAWRSSSERGRREASRCAGASAAQQPLLSPRTCLRSALPPEFPGGGQPGLRPPGNASGRSRATARRQVALRAIRPAVPPPLPRSRVLTNSGSPAGRRPAAVRSAHHAAAGSTPERRAAAGREMPETVGCTVLSVAPWSLAGLDGWIVPLAALGLLAQQLFMRRASAHALSQHGDWASQIRHL
mmetsp:Transcript_26812/g.86589  ORF Transcript_26812/g.86589 Transcript_26812/m.86589 type:complete len:205 (-) Transcript_26812:314-928(-)